MARTRTFVSSTCFDLGQVREDIRACLLQLGHEPLLSDYPSFPVLPDLGTVENCKRNVRENTDLFVLIIGGKRGSLDTATNKPVTNLEYETARQCGIDAFIFVKQSVLTMLPVWEKNPTADFSPYVDYPEVFSFVKNIQAEQKWVFGFEKASEITDILRIQLSVFLKSLLDRKNQGKLKPLEAFAGESPRAQQLALDRGDSWEYLLTEELLRNKLARVRRGFNELNRGLIYRQSRRLSREEFFNWVSAKCTDMLALIELLTVAATEEIPASWGPPGEAGDPLEIKRAVDNLISGCESMLEWEEDFRSVTPPESLQRMKELMQGWSAYYFAEIERFPDELAKPFRQPNPQGEFNVTFKFDAPPNIEELRAEMEGIGNDSEGVRAQVEINEARAYLGWQAVRESWSGKEGPSKDHLHVDARVSFTAADANTVILHVERCRAVFTVDDGGSPNPILTINLEKFSQPRGDGGNEHKAQLTFTGKQSFSLFSRATPIDESVADRLRESPEQVRLHIEVQPIGSNASVTGNVLLSLEYPLEKNEDRFSVFWHYKLDKG